MVDHSTLLENVGMVLAITGGVVWLIGVSLLVFSAVRELFW